MTWVRSDFLKVDGYDKAGKKGKRWISFTVDELLRKSWIVEEYLKKFESKRDIERFVIEEFDYPYSWFGSPTDRHCLNWFGWKWRRCIEDDYWQSISESLLIHKYNGGKGYGDCEDTSLLFTGLMNHKFGHVAYEMFGVVYENDRILGGHAWSIFMDDFGVWRLFESTLDRMPDSFPVVNPYKREFIVGDIKYLAFWKFNAFEFYDWSFRTDLSEYLEVRKHGREEKKKIKRIREKFIY